MHMPVSELTSSLHKSYTWVKELRQQGNFANDEEAFTALRAVLHLIRYKVVPNEAIQLGTELPVLLRGIYYEDFNLSAPAHGKIKLDFIAALCDQLRESNTEMDPEIAGRAVLELLLKKISKDEAKKVRNMLSKEIHQLGLDDLCFD